MNFAILDLGTNTFHLLIAEVSINKTWKKITTERVTVKLGQGGMEHNKIGKPAYLRGMEALIGFRRTVDGYHIDKIFGFGTAALRSAENGQEFIEEVKQKTGFDIQLISGDEEATLIYHGVRQVVQIGKEISLIMDIGGGSVEFIFGNDEQIFWKQSFKLGAALLQGKFQPEDPLSANDIKNIHSYFESELQSLLNACELFNPHQLIGSAGSFETFANMIKHRFAEQSDTKNNSPQSISITHFNQLYSDLIVSTKEQRNEMKGLVKMRVDMIVMAALLLKFVLTKVPLNKMMLSSYALKEGALWKMIQDYKKM